MCLQHTDCVVCASNVCGKCILDVWCASKYLLWQDCDTRQTVNVLPTFNWSFVSHTFCWCKQNVTLEQFKTISGTCQSLRRVYVLCQPLINKVCGVQMSCLVSNILFLAVACASCALACMKTLNDWWSGLVQSHTQKRDTLSSFLLLLLLLTFFFFSVDSLIISWWNLPELVVARFRCFNYDLQTSCMYYHEEVIIVWFAYMHHTSLIPLTRILKWFCRQTGKQMQAVQSLRTNNMNI